VVAVRNRARGRNRLRLNRLLKLLGILALFFRDTYPVVWLHWTEAAKGNLDPVGLPAAGYPKGLRKAFEDLMLGGGVANSAVFAAEVDKTKLILCSMLQGVSQGAEVFGRNHEMKTAPDQVEATVLADIGTFDRDKVPDLAGKCWRKYANDTAGDQTAAVISDSIVREFAVASLQYFHRKYRPRI